MPRAVKFGSRTDPRFWKTSSPPNDLMTLTLLVFGVVVWAIFDAIAHTNEVGWIGDGVSALPFVFSSWRMIGTPTGQQALGAVALLLCTPFVWLVLVSVLQQLGASE